MWAYSRCVGIARRTTKKLGSSQSVCDDLRILRSRGGFRFVMPDDLLGTRRLPPYRARVALGTDAALRDLRDHTERSLEAILDNPDNDVHSGPVVAAASLKSLLLSTSLSPPNALSVREEVGRPSNRGHDNVRYHENRLLAAFARDFTESHLTATTEPDIAAGIAALAEALMDISKAAARAIHTCEEVPWKLDAAAPPKIHDSISDVLLRVIKFMDRRDALLESAGDRTPVIWVLHTIGLHPWGPFIALPQIRRNATWFRGDIAELKGDVEAMNELIDWLWSRVTYLQRGIGYESESELHQMRNHSACLAAILPLCAAPDFHLVVPN